MSEELATNPVAGEEAPAPEVADQEDPSSLPDPSLEGEGSGNEEGEASQEETEEVDYEGRKYRVPKELKDGFLRQADYTRKTQEVAEQRKSVEANATALSQIRQVEAALAEERAEVKALDKQISQFDAVDWNALINQDPAQAQRLRLAYDQLKDARAKVAGEMTQKEQALGFELQQRAARHLEQSNQVLAREIPEWSQAKGDELANFAKSNVGMTDGELQAIGTALLNIEGTSFAKFAKLVHLAHVGQRALATAKTAPKPSQNPLPAPITPVRAKAPAARDPDRMSVDDWMKARNSQLRK